MFFDEDLQSIAMFVITVIIVISVIIDEKRG